MSLSTATGEHGEPSGQQNPEPTRRPGRASPVITCNSSRAPRAHVRWVAVPSLPRASGNPGLWNQEHDTKSSP